MTLGTTAGLTFTAGDGTADATMTFAGAQPQLNAALASLTYAPTADYNGAAALTFTVSDGVAPAVSKTVMLTVTPVADVVDDSVATPEDTAITFNVLTGTNGASADNFEDPGRAVTAVTQGANGTVSFVAGGTLVYTPNADYNGTDSFTYTVTSGGTTETGTVTVSVTPVNDAPVAVNDTFSTDENTSITTNAATGLILPNDTDVDGDALTVVAINGSTVANGQVVTLPSGALLTIIADGSFTYNPNGAFTHLGSTQGGTDSFTYQISDGNGTFATATATINIAGRDNPLTFSGLVDGSVAGTDGTVMESALASGSMPTGTNETTSGTFTISVPDGLSTLTVGGTTITAANLTSSATTPIVVATARGTITVNGFDSATGLVSYSYTLGSAADHSAGPVNETIPLVVTDVDGDTANASLALSIVDDTPIAANDADEVVNTAGNPSSVAYGNVYTGANAGKGGSDPNTTDGVADRIGADGATVPLTGVAAGSGTPLAANLGNPVVGTYGTLVLDADGTYRYTPDYANPVVASLTANNSVTDTFTYEIRDSDRSPGTATITLTIVGTPAIVGLGDGTVAGTDGSVYESDLPTGTTPAGTREVLLGTFQAIAPKGLVEINVGGTVVTAARLATVNFAPVTVTTNDGSIEINGYDASSGTVRYSYTLNAARDQSGGPLSDVIPVSLKDTDGDQGTGDLAIAIVDDAPVAVDDRASVTEDTDPVRTGNVVTPNDKIGADATPSPVTAVVAGRGTPIAANVGNAVAGLYGTLTLNADGSYRYTLDNANPTVDRLQAGALALHDVFTYQIKDGDGSTATASLDVAILGSNDPPTVSSPIADRSSSDGQAISFPVAGHFSDVDGNTLTYSATGLPSGLTLDPTTGVITGTLPRSASQGGPGGNGAYTVVVTASDGDGGTVSDTFTYTVSNLPPVAVDDSFTTAEDTSLSGTVAGNDSDTAPDSDPLTFTAATPPTNGTLALNPDGSFTYTPVANFNGTDTFTYTLSDGQGGIATGTVTVTVTAVNDPPTSTAPAAATMAEDTTLAFTGGNTLSVADVDNASLTVTLSVTNGTLTLGTSSGLTFTAGDGTADATMTFSGTQAQLNAALTSLTYVPTADYNGAAALTFTVSDGVASPVSRSVSLTVTPVADVVNDAVTTPEDTGVTFNVLTGTNGASADNFEDPGRAVTSVTRGAHGAATFAADGTLVYTPDANFSGTDSFTYTVTSGGTTETGTVTVNVTANIPVATSTISGTVFSDDNGNGDLNAGESGQAGVVVTLVDSRNVEVASTRTGAPGAFTFTGVPAGRYSVVAAFLRSDGTVSTRTTPVNVVPGVSAVAIIPVAGDERVITGVAVPPASSLSGSVYLDRNNDGVRGSNEFGLAHVLVTLTGTTAQGSRVMSTTSTDAEGNYTFSGLQPGTYAILRSAPSTFLPGRVTPGDLGGTARKGGIRAIVLTGNRNGTGNNFGVRPRPGCILNTPTFRTAFARGPHPTGPATVTTSPRLQQLARHAMPRLRHWLPSLVQQLGPNRANAAAAGNHPRHR